MISHFFHVYVIKLALIKRTWTRVIIYIKHFFVNYWYRFLNTNFEQKKPSCFHWTKKWTSFDSPKNATVRNYWRSKCVIPVNSEKNCHIFVHVEKANFRTKMSITTKCALRFQKSPETTFEPKVLEKFWFLPSISMPQNQLVFRKIWTALAGPNVKASRTRIFVLHIQCAFC